VRSGAEVGQRPYHRGMGEGTQSVAMRGTTGVARGLLLAIEAVGSLAMWAGIPLAWLWIGGRVYNLTGSLGADLGVAFLGFVFTLLAALTGLRRIDEGWIALRRRAGYEQEEGMLPQVVVASATLALVLFVGWYYLFSHAYVIPFMPST
jgi:hypothetical protein